MGWTFNTDSPDATTTGPTVAGVGIALTTLSLIVVCLRMYVRAWVVKAVGTDDWLMVFTWFMSLGFMVISVLQTRWGLGLQHMSLLPDENVKTFGLLQYCGAPFYIISILGFKLSLLFMFLRIAVDRTYRIVIIMIAVACTCFHLCFLIVQINLCQPVSKQWDPDVTWGSCLVAVPFYTSMASLTIVFDVIIICTPFPMLVKAKLPPRKKVMLLGVFSLGIFVPITQILRILTIGSLSHYRDSSDLIMWSMVENNLGIIVGSIPALAPLFRSILEKSSLSSPWRRPGERRRYSLRNIYRKKNRNATGNQNTANAPRLGNRRNNPADELWRTEGGSDEHLNDPVSIYTRTEIRVEHEPRVG